MRSISSTPEELYVKVKHSSITSETQQFHVDDFKFYTDTFTATDTQTPFTMFVVPELGVKTERNITVKALYDVNGAYEQIFDIKVVVTPKVATKVVLLIDNDQVIDRTYLESTAEVTVYYKDGTEKQGLAKDLIRLTDKEIEKIANAKDHLGITYGTASVFKKGRYELIAAAKRTTDKDSTLSTATSSKLRTASTSSLKTKHSSKTA